MLIPVCFYGLAILTLNAIETGKCDNFMEINSLEAMNATMKDFRILNTHMQPKYLGKHLLKQVCVKILYFNLVQ